MFLHLYENSHHLSDRLDDEQHKKHDQHELSEPEARDEQGASGGASFSGGGGGDQGGHDVSCRKVPAQYTLRGV